MKTLLYPLIYLVVSTSLFSQQDTIDSLSYRVKTLEDSISSNTKLVDAVSTLNKRLNRDFDGDKKERVQLGLSFAYGELSDKDKFRNKIPTIDPLSSKLVYQQLDGRYILVSTTMTVTPFLYADWMKPSRKYLNKRRSSFVKLEGNSWTHLWRHTRTVCNYLSHALLWGIENSGFSVNINFLEIATGSSEQSFNQIVEGGIGYSLRLNKNIYWSFTRELKFINSLNDSFQEGEPIYLNGSKVTSIDELSLEDQDYYHSKTLLHWSSRLIVNF